MSSRRGFLKTTAAMAIAALFGTSIAALVAGRVIATAITQVTGTGQKLTALALKYPTEIDTAKLTPEAFTVAGRTITRVYANTKATPAAQGTNGPFVIIELSPDDADAPLFQQVKRDIIRKDTTPPSPKSPISPRPQVEPLPPSPTPSPPHRSEI